MITLGFFARVYRYADKEGLTQCIPCPEGQECLVVTESPTLCPIGTYSDITCKPCGPGTYTDEEGKFTCTQCEVGGGCVLSADDVQLG